MRQEERIWRIYRSWMESSERSVYEAGIYRQRKQRKTIKKVFQSGRTTRQGNRVNINITFVQTIVWDVERMEAVL